MKPWSRTGLAMGALCAMLALPLAPSCGGGETVVVRTIKNQNGGSGGASDEPDPGEPAGGKGGASGKGGAAGTSSEPTAGTGGSGGQPQATGGKGGSTAVDAGATDAAAPAPTTDAAAPMNDGPFKVLAFTKTAGYKHESIGVGVKMLQDLAKANDYEVTVSADAAIFTDDGLDPFTVVFFMNTTDDILTAPQQAAFERFMKKGRGFAGVHAATDTEDSGGWPWYGELVGSFYSGHGAANETGTLKIDPQAVGHPAVKGVPALWNRTDEWYKFRRNVTGLQGVQILLRASSDDRPMAWTREYDGGRAFYTALGHTLASYDEKPFRDHVLGGLLWAANRVP